MITHDIPRHLRTEPVRLCLTLHAPPQAPHPVLQDQAKWKPPAPVANKRKQWWVR